MSANQAWNIYNFRRGLVKALLSNGIRISILAPRDECSSFLEELGCAVYGLPISAQGINPLRDAVLFCRFLSSYIKLTPDLIINYTIKPNIYGSIASKIAGIPSLAVTTGLGYTFINKSIVARIARMLYKIALLFPKEVWFLNADDQQVFLKYQLTTKNRTFVLNGEGCDVDYYRPRHKVSNDGKFRFLLIARMLWDKGIAEYVSAAKIVKARHPQASFQLLGATGVANPSAVSPEQLQSWQYQGLVDYLGTTSDVRPAIAEADCVVLPSYREGVPRTLMEAAAMGLPIVTTDVPGCREVVRDGMNGYLCCPRDAIDLAEKMERMIALTNAERAEMGRRGREIVEREFDEKIVIQKYLGMIRKLQNRKI